MKKMIGRKSVLMCLVGMMVILLGATAQATLITGGISFGADLAPALTGGADLSNNTGFSWAATPYENAHVLGDSTNGDFFDKGYVGDSAHFFDFTFDPTDPDAVAGQKLWEIIATDTPYFMMSTATVFSRKSTTITIDGTGNFFFPEFETTPGTFAFQSNSGGGAFTFSSSADATGIPEPGTLILLGSGLLGLALTGAKKKFRK